VKLHNSDDGGNPRTFQGDDYLYAVAITPDGKLVGAGGFASVLRIWDGETGAELMKFEPPK